MAYLQAASATSAPMMADTLAYWGLVNTLTSSSSPERSSIASFPGRPRLPKDRAPPNFFSGEAAKKEVDV